LKITNHKLCQLIVKKFIKTKPNWPREIKIAQKLIKKYKTLTYWKSLKDLNLPSLAWFLTEDGKAFLNIEDKKNRLIINKNTYNIKENKIGEDKNVCQKPKTLLEFIRYGKKT